MSRDQSCIEPEVVEEIELYFRKACLDPGSPHASYVARYLLPSDLNALLKRIADNAQKELHVKKRYMPSNRKIVDHLKKRYLIQSLDEMASVSLRKGNAHSLPFWLTLRSGNTANPNPYEILMALNRQGVISHYSALNLHGLTLLQQNDPGIAHYLTIPTKQKGRKQKRKSDNLNTITDSVNNKTPKQRKGTELFILNGVSFRTKQLVAPLLFGHRKEWTDDREYVQVFDVERSLLNTLIDPACNGGIRGIAEAWERGKELLDVDRMIDYLHKLSTPSLWRKTGAMASYIGLTALADHIQESMVPLSRDVLPIPLIRTRVTKGALSRPWEVIVPW